ncbi:MAG: hypothetical protein H6832_13195 [Planctomycetes bacterium]|nr:hypothetical protein [Planctomycetota bacterium]MCB9892635.1 hypothetical protein [Planctomycetota bacterium]MCB9919352.1 hypothetical protein [Planctomycetota bacterium]
MIASKRDGTEGGHTTWHFSPNGGITSTRLRDVTAKERPKRGSSASIV